ncbi:unnamed protein product [Leptidea sinapis]|uniref:Uncharacterized protein n=1 Tax=Leptidea sinapis TaxID=189913 RepID=A0A5E4Q1X7_9NEOP|nr:unnamed protein product [Leptidea sinapis]
MEKVIKIRSNAKVWRVMARARDAHGAIISGTETYKILLKPGEYLQISSEFKNCCSGFQLTVLGIFNPQANRNKAGATRAPSPYFWKLAKTRASRECYETLQCQRFIPRYKELTRRVRSRTIIVLNDMATRACVLLAICAGAFARDCIELTLSDRQQNILTDSLFNGTIVLTANNETYIESAKYDFLGLWDAFPKIVVPVNGTSEQCRRDSQMFLDSLDRLELWALKKGREDESLRNATKEYKV